MAQKGSWNLARNKALEDKGALPREEGDTMREYKAMQENNFLSSWLREDGKGKTKREMEVDKEVTENKGEDEMVVKRKCVNPVSVEAFNIFSRVVLTLTLSRGRGRVRF